MNGRHLIILDAIFAVLVTTACANASVENNSTKESDPIEIIEPEVISEVKESKLPTVFKDSLVGKFNGVDVDTLVAIPACVPVQHDIDWWTGDMYTEWRIHALNGTVEDLIVKETTGVHFIEEGDLDGNGTDEWGYMSEWYIGTWKTYEVFTCRNGKWKPLIKQIPICINQILDLINQDDEFVDSSDTNHYVWVDDFVRPHKKGWVKTRHCETNDDVTDWLVIEKTVRVNN